MPLGLPRLAAEMSNLTIRKIGAARPVAGKTVRLWDDDPRGFGVYLKPSGGKAFFVQYRSPVTQKKRRYTICQYGTLTLDQARTEARKILARVAKGEDPLDNRERSREAARIAVNVADFCDQYHSDAVQGLVRYRGKPKKPYTLEVDRGRIDRHIKPTLGKLLVRDVTARDIERAYHAVRRGETAVDEKTGPRGRAIVTGGAGTAGRMVTLLGSIFSYAIKTGIRLDNPAARFELPPDGKRDRYLLPDEYRRLGAALDGMENSGANAIAIRAIRALALTGCRRGEIYKLLKSEIDPHGSCLRLSDTKTGQQVRPIGGPALDILTLPPFDEGSNFTFPATRGDGHLTDAKVFRRTCKEAALEGVSLHTLRHSFASVALELEYSEMTIASLLGHRQHSVTARYAHHVDRALVAAADRVSAMIASRMAGRETDSADVVLLRATQDA